MATLDNSPSQFSGESWSIWLKEMGKNPSIDDVSTPEQQRSKEDDNTMKLRKEDMALYGGCPAQDEFFLSVCEKCGQVVKPQALVRHIEQRHGQKIPSPKKIKSRESISPISNKSSHRGHKTSPSSKADKSNRSRSAERSRDGTENVRKHIPVIKIERIDEPHNTESISTVHSSNSAFEKPKSYKEPYKEPKTEYPEELQNNRSDLSKQDTIPIMKLMHGTHTNTYKVAEKLPDLPSPGEETAFVKPHRSAHSSKNSHTHTSKSSSRSSKSHSSHHSSKHSSSHSSKHSSSSHSTKHSESSKSSHSSHKSGHDSGRSSKSGHDSGRHSSRVPELPDLPHKTEAISSAHGGKQERPEDKLKHCNFKSIPELPTADLPDPPAARSDFLQSGNLAPLFSETVVSEISIKSEDLPDLTSIPETSVGADSEELLKELEKLEETGRSQKDRVNSEKLLAELEEMEKMQRNITDQSVHVDKFDDMNASIKVKIESELQKIKVEDKSHIFQIDNRSTTPVLHIPDSPKSETPQSPSATAKRTVLTQQYNTLHVNGANTLSHLVVTQSSSQSSSVTNTASFSHQNAPSATAIKIEPALLQNALLTSGGVGVTTSTLSLVKTEPLIYIQSTPNKGQVMVSSNASVVGSVSQANSHAITSPSKKPPKDNKFIPCKDRIYDPEKHCGVWIADQERHCTRSLTCKTHSLSLRRGVQGRSKSFDEILADHKAAKEAMLKAKAQAKGEPYPPVSKTPPSSSKTPPSSSSKTPPSASSKTPPFLNKTPPVARQTSVTLATISRVVTVTSSSPIMSTARLHKVAPSFTPLSNMVAANNMHSVKQLLPFSSIPKPAVLPVLSGEDKRPLSDDVHSDEDSDFTSLAHHPAPLAVNSWGARQYGVCCYAFNQRADRLRHAVHSLVDSHSRPPPAKKLCLDTKSWKDPLKLSHGDNNDNVILSPPQSVPSNSQSLLQRQKSKSSAQLQRQSSKIARNTAVVLNNNVLATTGASIVNAGLKSGSLSSVASVAIAKAGATVGGAKQVGGTLKRKRSTGAGNVASSSAQPPVFSSPISITIPPGVSLASLGNTINATLVANPTGSQASNNNLSLVVSNSGTLMNGQFLNLQNLGVADVTQLQLANAGDAKDNKNRISAKIVPALGHTAHKQAVSTAKSLTAQPVQIDLTGSGNASSIIGSCSGGSVMTTLAPGTVLMETSQTGAPGATKLSNHSLQIPVNSTMLGKREHTANGVLPQGTGIQLTPISINQLSSVAELQQQSGNKLHLHHQPDLTLKLQGRNNSSLVKSHLQKQPATIRPNLHASTQHTLPTQHITATLNLTPSGNRLVAPGGNLQQVYAAAAGQMLGTHLTPVQMQQQHQQKAAGIGQATGTGATNKMLKQPVSLTIVAPGLAGLSGSGLAGSGLSGTGSAIGGGAAGLDGTQTRPLLITPSDATNQPDLSDLASPPPGSVT